VNLARLGFGARAVIHSTQIEIVNRVLTPSADDVVKAQVLVEAAATAYRAGKGVFVDENGRMVDEAILRSARRVLSRARTSSAESA
jgi:citrate lyase subunit beta/citryl-CoA lyase